MPKIKRSDQASSGSDQFYKSWKENKEEGTQKMSLRGLKLGFYPAKRSDGRASIRFW